MAEPPKALGLILFSLAAVYGRDIVRVLNQAATTAHQSKRSAIPPPSSLPSPLSQAVDATDDDCTAQPGACSSEQENADFIAHHANRISQRVSFSVSAEADLLMDYPPVGADGVSSVDAAAAADASSSSWSSFSFSKNYDTTATTTDNDIPSPFPLVRVMTETATCELPAPTTDSQPFASRARTLSASLTTGEEIWGHFEDGDGPVKVPSPSSSSHKTPSNAPSPLTIAPARPSSPLVNPLNNSNTPLHFSTTRSKYNRTFMPNRVLLVRHGQSEGNVNEELYETKPDPDMKLTERGWSEARLIGKAIVTGCPEWNGIAVGKESIHFVVSPYVRAIETFHGILDSIVPVSDFDHIENEEERLGAWYKRLRELKVSWHEDARIREQDFGNFQKPAEMRTYKRDRYRYGSFYYRFPHGESCSDVYDRCSTFLDSLWRSFEAKKSDNYVIVAHGASIRVLLTRYFRYTVDQFQKLANPTNGECMLLAHDGEGKLRFDGRIQLENVTGEEGKKEGYKFHKTMRLNPPNRCSNPRVVRMTNKEPIAAGEEEKTA
jgi:broad specificity phosphatase PhoE